MDKTELLHAMKLPPKEAVDYMEQKELRITERWHDLDSEIRARVFTVANVTKLDVLQAIRDETVNAMENNVSFKAFQGRLIPILKEKGWWGKAIDKDTGEVLESIHGSSAPATYGTPWRLKLIYDVNLQSSFMAGRRARQLENVSERPYWQYVAVGDSRTRPHHLILNGMVFKHDDPFFASFYPPNGYRCRCRIKAMSSDKVGNGPGLSPLSSSHDRLDKMDVPISSQHPEFGTIKVARYEYQPGKYVTTDPGWSHAPGEAWAPNLNKYHPDLVAQYRKATEK